MISPTQHPNLTYNNLIRSRCSSFPINKSSIQSTAPFLPPFVGWFLSAGPRVNSAPPTHPPPGHCRYHRRRMRWSELVANERSEGPSLRHPTLPYPTLPCLLSVRLSIRSTAMPCFSTSAGPSGTTNHLIDRVHPSKDSSFISIRPSG